MPLYVDDKFFPYAVALEVTLACNMRCIHCGSYANGQNRANSLNLNEWKKVIDELKSLKAKYFTLSGGEPFMYPHWRELVNYIKSENDDYSEISIISNGAQITEDDIRFLKSKKSTHIAISLDGNENTHDYIRQYKGAYNNVMNVIDMCQENNYRVGIVTSFNKLNFAQRADILKILMDKGVDIWQVQIVNSFGRAGKNAESLIVEKNQLVELTNDILKWKEEYGDKIKITIADSMGYCHDKIDKLLDGATWDGCSAGKYVLGIESNGNVKGCLSLQDDKFSAGNVRNRSLKDIWYDDNCFAYTRNYDPKQMEGNCQNCSSHEECKAGCLSMAYSLHKSIYKNEYCYKHIVESTL
ncbi:MAG: radical SAM protein [Pseudomonadota bacterium]